jgi:hypothetical protein
MAAQLIRNSKRAFRAAMEQHRAAGMESSLGYDHLRVAFMQRGVGVDIARARELLSTRLGSFHLAIFDGARSDSPRMRRARIEEAQTITSRLRYRGGLARSYFLAAAEDAEARTRRQRLDSAYGFAATYVAFPLDDNPQAIRALHDLGSVIRDGSDALSRSEMEHWLERFESDLRNHEGSFRLLAQLRGDTRQAEDAVMGKAKESLAREREANSLLPISAPQCPRSPQGCHLCRPAPMPSIYGRKARP